MARPGAEEGFGGQGKEDLQGDGRAAGTRAAGAADVPAWWCARSPAAFLNDRAGSGSLTSAPVLGRWGCSCRRCSPRSRAPADVPGSGTVGWGCPASLRPPGCRALAPELRWRLLAEGQGLLGFGSARQKRTAGEAGTDRRTRHSAWRGGLRWAAACLRVSPAAAVPGFTNCRSAEGPGELRRSVGIKSNRAAL